MWKPPRRIIQNYSCTVVMICNDTVDTELNGKNLCDSTDVESLETQWYNGLNTAIMFLESSTAAAVTLTTNGPPGAQRAT